MISYIKTLRTRLQINFNVGVLRERQLKIKVDIMNREDGQYSVVPVKISQS